MKDHKALAVATEVSIIIMGAERAYSVLQKSFIKSEAF
jgi:hypothetical protein